MADTAVRRSGEAEASVLDYRQVFSVLDRCGVARDLADFKGVLIDSLQSVLGVGYATFFQGPTLAESFADRDAVFEGGRRERQLMGDYHNRWSRSDPYATALARSRLERVGVATLRDLGPLPAPAETYVREFVGPAGLERSAALRLPLQGGAVGLVGLLGTRSGAIPIDERPMLLLLLGRQLRNLSALMPQCPSPEAITGLTPRQREVAALVGGGATNAAIAVRLGLTEDTVKKYVSAALAAAGCRSRTELALLLTR